MYNKTAELKKSIKAKQMEIVVAEREYERKHCRRDELISRGAPEKWIRRMDDDIRDAASIIAVLDDELASLEAKLIDRLERG